MTEISSDSSFLSQESEQKLLENIMIQKLDKKRNTNISLEIKKKKKMFDHIVFSKFGRHFLKIKPEAYLDLVDKCKTFYFSPDSKFLNNFPKLKKRIMKERNINYNKLLTKIDVGNLLYLSEARSKKKRDQNAQKNETLMAFSKNFATQNTKDVISDEIYKVKFWDKKSKNINKVLKRKYVDIFKKLIIKNLDNNTSQNNEFIDDKDKEEIKNLISFNKKDSIINVSDKKENSQIIKENNRYNPIIAYYNNIPNNFNGRKSSQESINIKIAKTSQNLKESNYNMNSIKDSSFPSIINNNNSLKILSNEKEKLNNLKSLNSISRNIKTLEIKKNLKTSLNFSTKPKSQSLFNSFKYKKNINNKVQDLNSQTKLCNIKLYNLIANNQTVLPEKRLKNSDKDFDMNYSLSETTKNFSRWKKNNQGTFSYLTYEKLNEVNSKSLKANNIDEIVKEAKNNMSSEGKIKKRELRLFSKRLKEMKDEFALQMVDKLFSREKLERHRMPEIKETVKEQREMKEHLVVNSLRKKVKNNYNKIIRMGFYLTKRKEKFNLTNNKYHRKSYKKRNNDDLKINNN